MQGLRFAILGRSGIVNLKVLQFPQENRGRRVMSIGVSAVKPFQEFLGLFDSLGEFKDEMEIRVKEGATPFLQVSPRVVPLPLLEKLEQELKRIVGLKIIVPVEGHTDLNSPNSIVVRKNDDSIRICCDYTQLNKSVCQAHYPIPKVESTLAKWKGSVYFSKLDTNSRFYQIKLKSSSEDLTTFITFWKIQVYKTTLRDLCARLFQREVFENLVRVKESGDTC